MRKGFTLVEILAVIAIIAVLVLIAVPTYNTISGTMKENVYNAKIEEIKAKSLTHAEETGQVVFSVDTLINEGKIIPDNETGVYKDPRSDRKMNCDIIHISFNNNQYEVNIEESETCYSDEELNNRYGIARLKVVDASGSEIPSIEGTEWLGTSSAYVTYEIKPEYQEYASNIVGVEWTGEETLSCTEENIESCNRYPVSTTSVKMLTVGLKLTIKSNEANIISNYTKNVYLDIVAPEVKEGSIILENEYNTNSERRVTFELTDYNGSGVKEYALVTEKTCTKSEYETNKKNANEGVQTEYLNNGTYYVCVTDKVGNKTPDSELEKNKIEVSNVDSGTPSVSLSINSKDNRYHTKEVTLKITASDNDGTSNLRMCISNTGYLQNCSWEAYASSKNWTLPGDYDGGTRKVYITIQDASGNIGQNTSSYTIYKSCATTTKNYTDSNYGTCSKTCGGGVQYRNYQSKDTYLGTTCGTGRDERSCNTQSCCSKTVDYKWGSWSTCSKLCNTGTQTRTVYKKSAYDGSSCGTYQQTQNCNTTSCCSKTEDYKWSGWSTCSKTCGGGTQTQTVYKRSTIDKNVTCGTYTQSRSCNTQSCGPSITDTGRKFELIIPVKDNVAIGFNQYSTPASDGCLTNSYVEATVITLNNNTLSYGKTVRITSGWNGSGYYQLMGSRLSDNRVIIYGNSRDCSNYSGSLGYQYPTVSVIQIDGTTPRLLSSTYVNNQGSGWKAAYGFGCTNANTCYASYWYCPNCTGSSYWVGRYKINISSSGQASSEFLEQGKGWGHYEGDIENRSGVVAALSNGSHPVAVYFPAYSTTLSIYSSGVYDRFGYVTISDRILYESRMSYYGAARLASNQLVMSTYNGNDKKYYVRVYGFDGTNVTYQKQIAAPNRFNRIVRLNDTAAILYNQPYSGEEGSGNNYVDTNVYLYLHG